MPILTSKLNPTPGFFARLLTRRHGGIALFFAVFLVISFLTRLALLVKSAHDVTWTLSLLAAFGWGVVYDLGAAALASLPLIVLLTILPSGALLRAWMRWLVAGFGFAVLFALLFGAVVGSSRVDLQACKLEYSIVSPK